jgi:hypothetical protein
MDLDNHIAINTSLSWVVHGLEPISDSELLARTGLTPDAAAALLERVHSIGPEEAQKEGIWFSIGELRSVERVLAGVLDGWIDILDDWELAGIDEDRHRRLHLAIARVLQQAPDWQRSTPGDQARQLRERARLDAELRARAEAHWLRKATLSTFD